MSSREWTNLDRPIWAALTSTHAHLGTGDEFARRYAPDVAPFAAVASETAAAFEALGSLLHKNEIVGLLCDSDASKLGIPNTKTLGVIHQMVATQVPEKDSDDPDMLRLGGKDAVDMLALAQRAKPGPFGTRTHETGNYIGMRDGDNLVAMAGERMQFDGYIEISSVCVDDAWRGKGLAARLVRTLSRQIALRGATPFLHVDSDNVDAIALYKRLGFVLRRSFFVVQAGAAC
ncbi:putative GNAT family acetyltransferase [Paraburkholderia sp. GAS199]|uniref:GNAT family N-acetyltransferase n=1 Tax=Paraburkholderia sp. GAS199 TaxID=3035126 RepID=UPI003D1E996A